ncbi:hypothetical protein [Bacillus paranthracis]|uniref:hypothetical protein n=1 Tax=Bacillus paranthracis TaxID=2026186 RepID=UPI003D20DF02
MDLSWYEEINAETPISQGDILFDCPIFLPIPQYEFSDLENLSKTKMGVATANVIIMTQACDLNTDNGKRPPKVDSVVVAVLYDVKGQKWGTVSDVFKDKVKSASLLDKNEDGIPMNWQIVSFKNLYTIPYTLLEAFRAQHGPRLRMKSPYLENLSQKFGNFFSRIGLPDESLIAEGELKEFVKKNEPKPETQKS